MGKCEHPDGRHKGKLARWSTGKSSLSNCDFDLKPAVIQKYFWMTLGAQ
jgi:hypothetical protein